MNSSMKNFLIVGFGGFIGASLRYFLTHLAARITKIGFFPIGTALVNILGCLAIGLLAGLAENFQPFSSNLRLFLFMGILGSFTTFSTFSFETLSLFRDGQISTAFLNISTQLILGFTAAFIGFQITLRGSA